MTRAVDAYTHKTAAGDDTPDGRPGSYYVSVRNGRRWALLYGPFGRHADALAAVAAVRDVAESVDPWACFYAFGTARMDGDGPPGSLNHLLPAIEEAAR